MNKIKQILGMGYTNPVVRTAVQAGLVVLVASGVDFVNVEVWRTAALAAGAAGFAALQAALRS